MARVLPSSRSISSWGASTWTQPVPRCQGIMSSAFVNPALCQCHRSVKDGTTLGIWKSLGPSPWIAAWQNPPLVDGIGFVGWIRVRPWILDLGEWGRFSSWILLNTHLSWVSGCFLGKWASPIPRGTLQGTSSELMQISLQGISLGHEDSLVSVPLNSAPTNTQTVCVGEGRVLPAQSTVHSPADWTPARKVVPKFPIGKASAEKIRLNTDD